MEIEGNILYAIDNDRNILCEFNEWEDAAKYYYNNNEQYKIILFNKNAKMAFIVPEDELKSIYKSIC